MEQTEKAVAYLIVCELSWGGAHIFPWREGGVTKDSASASLGNPDSPRVYCSKVMQGSTLAEPE